MPTLTKKTAKKQRRIPQQARSIAKYNAILDGCYRVLSDQGFSKITMSEISLESEQPLATIYQYFEDKEDIMIAWMERFVDQAIVQIAEQKQNLAHKHIELLSEQLIKSTLLLVAANKQSIRNLLAAMPFEFTSRLFYSLEKKAFELVTEMFSDNIAAINSEGLEHGLHTLTRAIQGYILQLILDPKPPIHIKQSATELSDMVNAYLVKRKFL